MSSPVRARGRTRGDVGSDPGRQTGRWLTSVMLALHPEPVDLAVADEDLDDELQRAGADRRSVHLERFVESVVDEVRGALLDRHLLH